MNDYAEKLCHVRKADPRVFRVPLRELRGEDRALQALQADFAAVHVPVVRQAGPVSNLNAF